MSSELKKLLAEIHNLEVDLKPFDFEAVASIRIKKTQALNLFETELSFRQKIFENYKNIVKEHNDFTVLKASSAI